MQQQQTAALIGQRRPASIKQQLAALGVMAHDARENKHRYFAALTRADDGLLHICTPMVTLLTCWQHCMHRIRCSCPGGSQ